jgi:hypothetical protein
LRASVPRDVRRGLPAPIRSTRMTPSVIGRTPAHGKRRPGTVRPADRLGRKQIGTATSPVRGAAAPRRPHSGGLLPRQAAVARASDRSRRLAGDRIGDNVAHGVGRFIEERANDQRMVRPSLRPVLDFRRECQTPRVSDCGREVRAITRQPASAVVRVQASLEGGAEHQRRTLLPPTILPAGRPRPNVSARPACRA